MELKCADLLAQPCQHRQVDAGREMWASQHAGASNPKARVCILIFASFLVQVSISLSDSERMCLGGHSHALDIAILPGNALTGAVPRLALHGK